MWVQYSYNLNLNTNSRVSSKQGLAFDVIVVIITSYHHQKDISIEFETSFISYAFKLHRLILDYLSFESMEEPNKLPQSMHYEKAKITLSRCLDYKTKFVKHCILYHSNIRKYSIKHFPYKRCTSVLTISLYSSLIINILYSIVIIIGHITYNYIWYIIIISDISDISDLSDLSAHLCNKFKTVCLFDVQHLTWTKPYQGCQFNYWMNQYK